jgi:hypothetical protein
VGGFEAGPPGSVEPTVEYHPYTIETLTMSREAGSGTLSGG